MLRWDMSFLFRKKKIDDQTSAQSKLHRVMGLLDITALGSNEIIVIHDF